MATAVLPAPSLDYFKISLYDGPLSSLIEPPADTADNLVLSGFPPSYDGERVWSGPDLAAKEDQWLTVLSQEEQADIVKALRHFQDLHLEPQHLSRETFPLPQALQQRLRKLSQDCYGGRGFAILRGMQTEQFTEEENVLIFAGISSYVAPVRGFQDTARKTVTCHVYSEECRPGAEEHKLRPAFTNGRLAFHTDLGDILSLFTIEPAEHGGNTTIVSSSKIYNEIAKARPDLLHELSKPWVFYTAQNYESARSPLIANVENDKLVLQFSRLPVTGYRNYAPSSTAPKPSAKRLEAMSMVEELGWQHCFHLPGKRGDIAYINNLTLLHAREAFDLDVEGKPCPSKRHLVKLMLQDPELAWDLPEALRNVSEMVYGPNMPDQGRAEVWQLTAIPKDASAYRAWAGDGGMSNG